MRDSILSGGKNRVLQILARFLPGATTLRVWLHRWRGVTIGKDVWIGYDTIIETGFPKLVYIGDRAAISIRVLIIGHFRSIQRRDRFPVRIEEDAYIGPGCIILPNVTVGRGAVVAAGSVVTRSVPPMTMVQGNPAVPVAKCGVPLVGHPVREFYRKLKPLNAGALERAS